MSGGCCVTTRSPRSRTTTSSRCTRATIVDEGEAYTLEEIEAELLEWLKKHDAIDLWVASCNPTFDRAWVAKYFPRIARLFHSHRNFEMNTVYALHRIPKPKKSRDHRGLDDLNSDIAAARKIWKKRARRPLVVRVWNGILDALRI